MAEGGIWNVITTVCLYQGKVAATYFWPGSEVDGNHPTYWYHYNESISFQQRVEKVGFHVLLLLLLLLSCLEFHNTKYSKYISLAVLIFYRN